MTPLDQAFSAMQADPENEALRRAYLDRLCLVEMFLLLECEAEGEVIEPRVFDLDEGPFVLAFDTEERLSECMGSVFYASLPGSDLVALLPLQGLGLAINLGSGSSENLLPPETLAWLSQALESPVSRRDALPNQVVPPTHVAPELIAALDARLAAAAGLAEKAVLARAQYDDGERLMLAVIDAPEPVHDRIASSIREAMAVTAPDQELDVVFLDASDATAARLTAIGLSFEVPAQEDDTLAPGAAPGLDPAKPPKLR